MSANNSNGKKTGKIIWFDHGGKGFGFIDVEGSKDNLFVHVTDVIRSGIEPSDLKPGVAVSFRIKPSTKDASRSLAADLEII